MTTNYLRAQFPPQHEGSRYNRAATTKPVTHRHPRQKRGTPAQVAKCLQSRRNTTIFNELYPQPKKIRQSTYLLTKEELESLANKLFAAGWAIEEILERHDIDPPDKQ